MKIIINILRFNLKANKLENVPRKTVLREKWYRDEAGAFLLCFIKNNDKPLMGKAICEFGWLSHMTWRLRLSFLSSIDCQRRCQSRCFIFTIDPPFPNKTNILWWISISFERLKGIRNQYLISHTSPWRRRWKYLW
jgi:hypothetical protein